ncbi:hypothetical protein [Croceimicrobium hydrocarbonivorans]|uniref:Uncharacterized protein n=1 Tax=Croceimicrobium hydrocarbonivorans TaxID=2761580 RepID=A0A7H0VB74_9FLAO|nr:hypothetical protein [Croceimicrobium hydrocarbonivorans]QNR22972.1 hypothetical protein H4K34_11340 [Croceimicrobium hydrocarbonivorans]
MSYQSTFEKCKIIREFILNESIEALLYAHGQPEHWFERISKIPSLVQESEGDFSIDPNDLSREERIDLGFKDLSNPEICLIPVWLYPFLAPEFNWVSIKGKRGTKKPRDIDSRLGHLGFGVDLQNNQHKQLARLITEKVINQCTDNVLADIDLSNEFLIHSILQFKSDIICNLHFTDVRKKRLLK